MKDYLFVFSIGPVQSFIAASRKTEDLWSGSFLLSHLAEQALKTLLNQHNGMNPQLIFPFIDEEELNGTSIDESAEIASLPNRISVKLTVDRDDEVIQLGDRLSKHVQEAFTLIGKDAIEKELNHEVSANEHLQAMAEQQIADMLETYWAFTPLTGDYERSRRLLEKKLASVKNNRPVSANRQNGLVCTICGLNEALHEGNPLGGDYNTLKQQIRNTWSYSSAKIEDNEWLCAVCLCKRHARTYFRHKHPQFFKPFPSVDQFTEKSLPYYGIIMIDGDDMGQWFSGKNVDAKTTSMINQQQQISKRLGRYARQYVPDIVKQHRGTLVYAGGDDILAFAQIRNIFAMARQLREAFSDDRGLGENATSSAGIIIAHKKAPLQQVLQRLRSLEGQAKHYQYHGEEKNAFALSLLTHAGEIREVVLPWSIQSEAEKSINTMNHLQYVTSLLNDTLSSTFLYHFGEAFLPLVGAAPAKPALSDNPQMNQRLLFTELRRLVERSVKEGVKDVDQEVKYLLAIYHSTQSLMEFVHLLEMLRFFSAKEIRHGEAYKNDAETIH